MDTMEITHTMEDLKEFFLLQSTTMGDCVLIFVIIYSVKISGTLDSNQGRICLCCTWQPLDQGSNRALFGQDQGVHTGCGLPFKNSQMKCIRQEQNAGV